MSIVDRPNLREFSGWQKTEFQEENGLQEQLAGAHCTTHFMQKRAGYD
jgi:hypothetical protein